VGTNPQPSVPGTTTPITQAVTAAAVVVAQPKTLPTPGTTLG